MERGPGKSLGKKYVMRHVMHQSKNPDPSPRDEGGDDTSRRWGIGSLQLITPSTELNNVPFHLGAILAWGYL